MIIHLALTKFHTELELEDKCVEMQTLMDIDPPADKGLVKTLLSESTRKETQKIRAKLGQLKKKLKDLTVKDSRGQ